MRKRILIKYLMISICSILLAGCGTGLIGNVATSDDATPLRVSPMCAGEVTEYFDSTCQFVDEEGNVITGDVYVDGELWDGTTVPCDLEGDGFLIEIYETPSASISKARVSAEVVGDARKLAEATVARIRPSGDKMETYEVSAEDATTYDYSGTFATDECTCRIYNVYSEMAAASPDINVINFDTSGRTRSLYDADTTDWKIMGNYCDVDAKGNSECSEPIMLADKLFPNSSAVDVMGGDKDGVWISVVAPQSSGARSYYMWQFMTSMEGDVATLADSNIVSATGYMSRNVGTSDAKVWADGRTASLISSYLKTSGLYSLDYCIGEYVFSEKVGEEVYTYSCTQVSDDSPRYAKMELDEENQRAIITYMTTNDLGDSILVLAVGSDEFSVKEIMTDIFNIDAYYKNGKLYVLWTDHVVDDSPANLHLSIIDVDSGSVLETTAITTYTDDYYTVDNPQIEVFEDVVYIAYAVMYYHVLGVEGKTTILEASAEGTTGYFFGMLDLGDDGLVKSGSSYAQKQHWEDGWTDSSAGYIKMSVDGTGRIILKYTTFENRTSMVGIIQ